MTAWGSPCAFRRVSSLVSARWEFACPPHVPCFVPCRLAHGRPAAPAAGPQQRPVSGPYGPRPAARARARQPPPQNAVFS